MENKNKICPECETANEAEYTYCKNCGAALPEQNKEPLPPYCAEKTEEETVCPNCKTVNLKGFNFCKACGTPLSPEARYSYGEDVTEVDGVPAEDLKLFVGKNGEKIVPKWAKNNRRSSFCWPVFLLTAFLGFAGAAFWYLYRRMYKYGILLLIAALVLFSLQVATMVSALDEIASSVVNNAEFNALSEEYLSTNDYAKFSNGLASLLQNSPETMEKILKYNNILNLFNVLEFTAAMLLGMFSLRIYKKFAFSKLKIFTEKPTATELSLSGGTSAGALAIGILVYIMLTGSILVSAALSFIFM